ncbi:MAG TPA: molybdopterin-binding protein [Vicinamibacteria bacterium]|nr:molybdopterin-binding protein [Vicinamibacteria bacterium]
MTAAFLVIGNEILTGKVREANVYELARTLQSIGLSLERIVVIPDEVDTIAAETAYLAKRFDHVFTSGGVGPTHDDETIAGIAAAFGVPVVQDPELIALLREHYGERLHENHLILANVPQGSRKLFIAREPWPLIVLGNVFILPGLPEIFRAKLDIVREHLAGEAPFVSRAVFTKMDEAVLKPLLDRIVADHPRVRLGSYPRWNDPKYETKVTFDGKDQLAVEQAVAAFLLLLPEGEPQWTE